MLHSENKVFNPFNSCRDKETVLMPLTYLAVAIKMVNISKKKVRKILFRLIGKYFCLNMYYDEI